MAVAGDDIPRLQHGAVTAWFGGELLNGKYKKHFHLSQASLFSE